jgi:hypothetical protein
MGKTILIVVIVIAALYGAYYFFLPATQQVSPDPVKAVNNLISQMFSMKLEEADKAQGLQTISPRGHFEIYQVRTTPERIAAIQKAMVASPWPPTDGSLSSNVSRSIRDLTGGNPNMVITDPPGWWDNARISALPALAVDLSGNDVMDVAFDSAGPSVYIKRGHKYGFLGQ